MELKMNLDNSENITNGQSQSLGETNPGSFLASEREKRGISVEYIANKLNLRAQVLLHLESDNYGELPNPVFVKGYIRAYCKCLDISADPVIEAYNAICPKEVRFEKPLWQNQAGDEKAEKWLHWMTAGFAVVAIVSVSMWWFENKSNESIIPSQWRQTAQQESKSPAQQVQVSDSTDVKLTDLSKMRQMLTANDAEENTVSVETPAETQAER